MQMINVLIKTCANLTPGKRAMLECVVTEGVVLVLVACDHRVENSTLLTHSTQQHNGLVGGEETSHPRMQDNSNGAFSECQSCSNRRQPCSKEQQNRRKKKNTTILKNNNSMQEKDKKKSKKHGWNKTQKSTSKATRATLSHKVKKGQKQQEKTPPAKTCQRTTCI